MLELKPQFLQSIGMNKLSLATRVQILSMLCEGSSMRSISRVADVSINTVSKLLIDAGLACVAFHDETVRSVKASRIECDEIWSFCYSKQRSVATAKAAPAGAGDDCHRLIDHNIDAQSIPDKAAEYLSYFGLIIFG